MWTSVRTTRRALTLLLLLAGLGEGAQPGLAGALELTLAPIQVYLAPTQKSAILRIGNPNPQPLTVQVTVFTWSQDAEGHDKLEPTTDLLVFPQMLNLHASSERNVRVGTTNPDRSTERTFRLLIEPVLTTTPLPDDTGKPTRSAITTIITRSSVPVFIEPTKATPAPLTAAATLEAGTVRLRITNPGRVHLPPPRITLKGYASGDELVLDGEHKAWYVLGGSTRTETIALPAETCPQLTRLVLDLRSGQQTETLTVPVTPDRCAP
jgi:fimbrial chaperone protein